MTSVVVHGHDDSIGAENVLSIRLCIRVPVLLFRFHLLLVSVSVPLLVPVDERRSFFVNDNLFVSVFRRRKQH